MAASRHTRIDDTVPTFLNVSNSIDSVQLGSRSPTYRLAVAYGGFMVVFFCFLRTHV